MRNPSLIWFLGRAYNGCTAEADKFYPLETGGVLMGYWSQPDIAVVTAIIGAGPEAKRERHHFEPDQEWQLGEIARHYRQSGRRETYLGDWHSHPDAKTSYLSFKDCTVLRRIINTPAARSETPLMLILHGRQEDWQRTMWRAALKPRPIFWSGLHVNQAAIRFY